jgi:multisubunit Na+/H+ antiporter MnhE subunit
MTNFIYGIKADTGEIRSTLGEMKSSLNSIDNTPGTFVIEQKEHNQWMKDHSVKMDEHSQWMKDHSQRLEKILEKLAER